nr:hypothetical protein [Paraburkholderia sp. BL8N3]
MAAIWHGELAPTLSDIDRSAVTDGVKTMFGSVTDDLREAAQIPQGRGLNANEMREVCEIVLNEIFGTQGA